VFDEDLALVREIAAVAVAGEFAARLAAGIELKRNERLRLSYFPRINTAAGTDG